MIKLVQYAKIQINYKSGISMIMKCTTFDVTIAGERRDLKWTRVGGNRPLFMNVDDVESIYQIGNGVTLVWTSKN